MATTSTLSPRLRALLQVGLFAVLLSAGACSDDPTTPAVTANNTGTNNVGTNNANNTADQTCTETSDCTGDAAGMLCIGGMCRACVDDAACADDPAFGVGATCSGGACSGCQGQLDCACDAGDTCREGVCQDGVCGLCPTGEEGCGCFGNGTCGEGLRCEDEACAPCPPGAEGCACDVGERCNGELVCMDGLCAPSTCVEGAEGCPCGEGDTCDEGLTCSDGGMCAPCSSDIEGCPCDEDGECQEELVCDEDDTTCREALACADVACVPNQRCDEAQGGQDALCLEECLPGFDWNAGTSMCDAIPTANCDDGAPGSILAMCVASNRLCVATAEGASCAGCLDGFTDVGGTLEVCRAVIGCGDLDCAAQNRECTPGADANSDAACGACLVDFHEDNGACVPDSNCEDGAVGSILAMCQTQHRLCVESGAGASCGGCESGYAESNGTCVPEVLCADLNCTALGRTCSGEPMASCGGCVTGTLPSDPDDPTSACRNPLGCGDITCPDDEFCIDPSGVQDAFCQGWPCVDLNGEPDTTRALRQDTNTCVTCGLLCGDDGETGDLWPYTLQNSNRCICETTAGYYADVSGAFVSRACDGDGDGWVRESARSAIESADPALVANARCDLRTIDRFTLENEWGQRRDILICEEGLKAADQGACVDATTINLYESVRNDDQNQLNAALDTDVPPWQDGTRGRRPRASEINSLSRACVSSSADYNDNDVADVREWHGMTVTSSLPFADIYTQASYFMETHRSWYEEDLGQTIGRYIVQERSRCDTDFPLSYDSSVDRDYWQSCTRNRDSGWNANSTNPRINLDFAGWACDATQGTCPLRDPVYDVSVVGEVPDHGLCEVALPPTDGVWRGMMHHSQFRCAVIDDVAPADPAANPEILVIGDLTDSAGVGPYQFNLCGVACPDGDTSCNADCDDDTGCATTTLDAGEINPDSPVLSCAPVDRSQVTADSVGFVSVRYDGVGSYERGCIDEWNAWPELCPGYTTNPAAVVGQGNPNNFGKAICGCGFNYGGAECDEGCATEGLHYGGTRTDGACANGYCAITDDGGGRAGYWMCADFASSLWSEADATLGHVSTGGGYTLDSSIPQNGVLRERLCENADCASGWSVR